MNGNENATNTDRCGICNGWLVIPHSATIPYKVCECIIIGCEIHLPHA